MRCTEKLLGGVKSPASSICDRSELQKSWRVAILSVAATEKLMLAG
jgi:hypothetical protein